jgi:histidyl-tRNA synthetase
VKLTVVGPMFRYDRPQAGRYRQFWQWDAEALGDPGPAVDAELIEFGWRFYNEAGVPACRCCSTRSATRPAGRHISKP